MRRADATCCSGSIPLVSTHRASVLCLLVMSGRLTSLLGQSNQIEVAAAARAGNVPVREISVPLIIEHQDRGEIKVIPAEKDELRLEARTLLGQTKDLLTETAWKRLEDSIDPHGQLTLGVIKVAGMDARFDERNLDLEVSV